MKSHIKLQAGEQTREHMLEMLRASDPPKATQGKLRFVLDGKSFDADWAEVSPGVYSILLGPRSYQAQVSRTVPPARSGSYGVTVGTRHYGVEVQDQRLRRYSAAAAGPEGPQEILAPMPGKVIKVLVSEGQRIEVGQGLLVIEAMKMQNELRAPRSGSVEKIHVGEGAGVESGSKLLRLG